MSEKIKKHSAPDRIILLEIGLIIALVFCNWFMNLEYSAQKKLIPLENEDLFTENAFFYYPPKDQPSEAQYTMQVAENSASTIFELVDDLVEIIKKQANVLSVPSTMGLPELPNVAELSLVVIPNIEDEIYEFPSETAEFVGGDFALQKFIDKNYQIPRQILEMEKGVKLLIEAVIDKNGKVLKVNVLECSLPGLGAEQSAIAMFKKMPQWIPAMVNGQAVSSKIRLPLTISVF